MTRKSGKHLYDIQSHWTALRLISSVYCNLPHRKLNQQPQNAELKLYVWATGQHHMQAMSN